MAQAFIKEGKLYISDAIISLKSFKYMPSLSDETNCFTAKVVLNNAEIGGAENRGCGGQTSVYPSVKNRELYEQTQSLIKESRLGSNSEFCDYPLTISNLEDVVDYLVVSLIMAKEAAKAIKKLDKPNSYLIGLIKTSTGVSIVSSKATAEDMLQGDKQLEEALAGLKVKFERTCDLTLDRSMPDFHEKYLEFLGLSKEVKLITLPETTAQAATTHTPPLRHKAS
jgi:hypothetical protein